MTTTAKRITARWVLPVTAAPIPDGALLTTPDGQIAAIGPDDDVPTPEDAEEIELGEAALLPGLINVHGHPELSMLRGLLDDLAFHRWIPALNHVKHAANFTSEDYQHAALWTCVEALAAGVTTFAATEDSGEALSALRIAGMRGTVYREVFGPAPERAESALDELRSKIGTMRKLESPLVRVGVSPHAPYTVSDRLFQRTAAYALEEGLPIAVHAAEASVERAIVQDGTGPFADGLRARGITVKPRGRSTIELLDRLGVLDARPLLIHCIDVDEDDLETIAQAGASVAHCPAANARLGHGVAPLIELQSAGITVGLGTDSVASNNRLDLLEEARLAQLFQRAGRRDPALLPADELLRLTTLEGARALGIDDRVGSLEPGKDADLCAIRLDGAHAIPLHDPVSALFHAARAPDVTLSAVQGRILYRNGEHTTLDVDALRGPMASLAARAAAATQTAATQDTDR